ncbi:MAG: methylenetetrahydrofolate reductase C-terminal domain-containing protein [Candidatus Altiarchaeota archaeon]|nr:methylenetetrahydrofolate reductase C-terminal domain-containing protein [Candidatus Altiarchaeota archaeon]
MVFKDSVAGFDVVNECPKKMLNGPCGGMKNGMCEVKGPCIWLKIYAKLKSEDRLSEFTKVRIPTIK